MSIQNNLVAYRNNVYNVRTVNTIYDSSGNELFSGTATPGYVRLTDGTRDATFDMVHSALNTVDALHHEIHQNHAYTVQETFTDLADDASVDFLIVTGPDKELHTTMKVALGGNAFAFLYEDVVVTSSGTGLTLINRHREASDTTESIAYANPLYATGAALWSEFLPGGIGPKSFGGQGSSREEIVLKRSTSYAFKLLNVSGAVKDGSLGITFYEETVH